MTIQPITGILVAIVFAETVTVMILWQYLTRGAWVGFPAGRVLMGLLAVMAAITALAAGSMFFPAFPGRPLVYLGLYTMLIIAVGSLGFTIIREQRRR
jgi:hypothetical protein